MQGDNIQCWHKASLYQSLCMRSTMQHSQVTLMHIWDSLGCCLSQPALRSQKEFSERQFIIFKSIQLLKEIAQPVMLQLLLTSKHISTDIPSARISNVSLFLPFSSCSIHTSTLAIAWYQTNAGKSLEVAWGVHGRGFFYFVCVPIASSNSLSLKNIRAEHGLKTL